MEYKVAVKKKPVEQLNVRDVLLNEGGEKASHSAVFRGRSHFCSKTEKVC